MSANLLSKAVFTAGLSVWVVLALIIGQTVAALIVVNIPYLSNSAIQATAMAALGYAFAIAIAMGGPMLIKRLPPTRQLIGMQRLPSWSDIGLSLLALLPYYLLSSALLYLGTNVFHVIDPTVGQDIAFKQLSTNIEYIVAFVTLVIMAPIAEELLFRGYFFGKLSARTNQWVALIVTSLIFGSLHLIGGASLQWGAAVDTFAMGIVAGSLRISTGSIWAGILLHAMKNSIAFYALFIVPLSVGGM